jgi:protein-tyrosine phosphatase
MDRSLGHLHGLVGAQELVVSQADDIDPSSWKSAALWLLFLGPFFFLTYGFCNWYAAQLTAVPSVYYSWERRIPFLPQLILPYFSIDLFFAGAIFLCRDARQLRIHGCRVIAAILISATVFLLYPLKFAFDRPAVAGINGFLFDLLDGFDKPYNQAPSLHVSLLLIVWVRYANHLVGWLRKLVDGWFTLIGLSILFVFQHHVIDIWSGFVVGVICLYVWPDAPRRWQRCAWTIDPRRRRLGFYYLTGAIALALVAAIGQAWAWLLIWPAGSLALVASAYWFAGPAVFQKSAGRHSWPARLLLAPYLFGAWLSYRLFTLGKPALAKVEPSLYLGRLPRAGDLDQLAAVAILDLTAEFAAVPIANQRCYYNLPILDLTVPETAALRAALIYIDDQIKIGAVYVHCALGLSRSAAVVAAWLVHAKRYEAAEQALGRLQTVRPGVTWSTAHVAAITAVARNSAVTLHRDAGQSA